MRARGLRSLRFFHSIRKYSLAATETSLQHALGLAKTILPHAQIKTIRDFFDSPDFLDAFAESARADLQKFNADYVLFSFHGLPERHVKKTDPSGAHCLVKENCCDRITEVNRNCYRAQCFHTAHELAKRLGLPKDKYSVSFQSRLGRTPWIKPYTDVLYETLPKQGFKKIAVLCPAFVADCLETLEENSHSRSRRFYEVWRRGPKAHSFAQFFGRLGASGGEFSCSEVSR